MLKSLISIAFIAFLIISCKTDKNDKVIIKTKDAPEAIGPYSQGIMKGSTLYTSGQIAIDPKTNKMVNDLIEGETQQVMKNLEAILNDAGMDFENVLQVNVYLRTLDDYKGFNKIYATYFDKQPPARTTVEIDRLPQDARVEIAVIAKK